MYIGFDIGGSSIKAALVQRNKIVGTRYERLPKNFKDLVKTLVVVKNDLTLNKTIKIKGIGFSVAGAMDKKREKMLMSPNIQYLSGKNLLEVFRQSFPAHPVKIERDSICFLIAESKVGQGRRYKDIFYVTLGTGIGGALMINGNVIIGCHGSAGEIGHTIVDLAGETHWEDTAANKFIQEEMGIRFSEAKQKALAGDKKAIKVFNELGRNIGLGIANIINSFDPEAVIISGGLSAGKQFYKPFIKAAVEKNVISQEARKTKVLWSKLGRFGGALGAALLFEK